MDEQWMDPETGDCDHCDNTNVAVRPYTCGELLCRRCALEEDGWLAARDDGFDAGENDPCIICGHPRPEHYAWSTECGHIDGNGTAQ